MDNQRPIWRIKGESWSSWLSSIISTSNRRIIKRHCLSLTAIPSLNPFLTGFLTPFLTWREKSQLNSNHSVLFRVLKQEETLKLIASFFETESHIKLTVKLYLGDNMENIWHPLDYILDARDGKMRSRARSKCISEWNFSVGRMLIDGIDWW